MCWPASWLARELDHLLSALYRTVLYLAYYAYSSSAFFFSSQLADHGKDHVAAFAGMDSCLFLWAALMMFNGNLALSRLQSFV